MAPQAELLLPAARFAAEVGHAWTAPLGEFATLADTVSRPASSPLILLEDGVPLGQAHAAHAQIRAPGCGRYSHWGETLYFASSDNSPPNANGRRYVVLIPGATGLDTARRVIVSRPLIRLERLTPEAGLCWTCLPLPAAVPTTTRTTRRSHACVCSRTGAKSARHTACQIRFGSAAAAGFRIGATGFTCPPRSLVEGPINRDFTALVEPPGEAARRAVLATAVAVDAEHLSPEMRYAWAERVFSAFVPDVKLAEFGRSLFHDRQFVADYERFERQNYRSFDRKFALRELLRLALRRPGALAECGVFRGARAFLMAPEICRAGRPAATFVRFFAGCRRLNRWTAAIGRGGAWSVARWRRPPTLPNSLISSAL